jgi:hypothetical protein
LKRFQVGRKVVQVAEDGSFGVYDSHPEAATRDALAEDPESPVKKTLMDFITRTDHVQPLSFMPF